MQSNAKFLTRTIPNFINLYLFFCIGFKAVKKEALYNIYLSKEYYALEFTLL